MIMWPGVIGHHKAKGKLFPSTLNCILTLLLERFFELLLLARTFKNHDKHRFSGTSMWERKSMPRPCRPNADVWKKNSLGLQSFQNPFPQNKIRVIEISKGVDRFRKCPVTVRRGEAPYRRSFGAMRNGQVFDSPQWEEWEKWSIRKMTTKCEPMRMMITVFSSMLETAKTSSKREHPPAQEEEDSIKKRRGNVVDSSLREFEKELFPEKFEEKPEDNLERKNHEEKPETQHVEHGEKFKALAREEQQWIRKIHKNLGHPNAAKLINVLKGQKCDSRIIDAIPDFHCSTCHELSQPKKARPARTIASAVI